MSVKRIFLSWNSQETLKYTILSIVYYPCTVYFLPVSPHFQDFFSSKIFVAIFLDRMASKTEADASSSSSGSSSKNVVIKQKLTTLDKNFEERVNMMMRTNADTTNESTNIAVCREDALCMFERGEMSIAEARREILKVRMRAASENIMAPTLEAPSGYHQGFVSVRTPYDPVGANYRRWVVLDYEPEGQPVMRICSRRNSSPDEINRDVVCWFTDQSCVIPHWKTDESKDVTELSLSIDGVYMSTSGSDPAKDPARNRYQIMMSFCVKNWDVMWQWYVYTT